ncbi:D-arabinose 1-dehydrogenase-like Zn-dependent alcohol dehydrogenase [Crossiella cryophila]|uniref:D-arabinose 1-dehydrogenase-like Zn-dependent alcohol dehydrogenase n=1 Tax=Crossiella cryophila TaxID=43355 RepID=A0A7W7FS78_9PSEU|nr:D-arabinose 1-dehydrogenase-like Zn-dependent alcohol dehydrogenase [Crossiella cryophila]
MRGAKLDARVAELLPMDRAGEALTELTAGGVTGKIVLTP